MPAIATEIIFFLLQSLPQYVSAPTGHCQVEQNINHLSMVLSMPQWIRCFVIV
jgi:hypothetical protein